MASSCVVLLALFLLGCRLEFTQAIRCVTCSWANDDYHCLNSSTHQENVDCDADSACGSLTSLHQVEDLGGPNWKPQTDKFCTIPGDESIKFGCENYTDFSILWEQCFCRDTDNCNRAVHGTVHGKFGKMWTKLTKEYLKDKACLQTNSANI